VKLWSLVDATVAPEPAPAALEASP
jgi:hypothetical protein